VQLDEKIVFCVIPIPLKSEEKTKINKKETSYTPDMDSNTKTIKQKEEQINTNKPLLIKTKLLPLPGTSRVQQMNPICKRRDALLTIRNSKIP